MYYQIRIYIQPSYLISFFFHTFMPLNIKAKLNFASLHIVHTNRIIVCNGNDRWSYPTVMSQNAQIYLLFSDIWLEHCLTRLWQDDIDYRNSNMRETSRLMEHSISEILEIFGIPRSSMSVPGIAYHRHYRLLWTSL